MTQEEYKAKFSEDDAPGWDAIEGALEKIYDPANERHYSSQLHASLGGEDYLAGVSIFDSIKGAPHRKILILDGTQGNAGLAQAKAFNDMVSLDGVIITKLDGTPKGGALFGVARELELPILYIGTGETMDDLVKFDPHDFVDTIVDEIYA